jgi:REP element-mobilizing transposase RayT
LGSDLLRVLIARQCMQQPPYWPGRESRTAVLSALREYCVHRGWSLLAAHLRTNHVHAIVEADLRPEKVVNEFKSYASRELNRLDHDGSDRSRKDEDLQQALQYVVEDQGEPMALFIAEMA